MFGITMGKHTVSKRKKDSGYFVLIKRSPLSEFEKVINRSVFNISRFSNGITTGESIYVSGYVEPKKNRVKE